MNLLRALVVLASAAFLLSFSMGAFHQATAANQTEDRTVVISIQHTDGRVTDLSIAESELATAKLNFEDVMACTYQFSNGECTVTASTCAAAQAGFYACACAAGHTRFCGESTD